MPRIGKTCWESSFTNKLVTMVELKIIIAPNLFVKLDYQHFLLKVGMKNYNDFVEKFRCLF